MRRRLVRETAVAVDHFTLNRMRRLCRIFTVLILRVGVHIEDPEADAGFREISADSHLDGREAVVRKRVCTCYDGQHVDSGRQSPDGTDFISREGWTA